MLQSHLNAIEAVLLAQSITAQNAGHPNLRGGPREWFIRDFLSTHLPGTLEVGQGEIIDASSKPSPDPKHYRPQVDIVLYRKDVPRISLSQNDHVFLAEGVMATIEVKSLLKKSGKNSLLQACKSSIAHKKLKRSTPAVGMGYGWMPEHIVTYVVAFDGPAKIKTVASWLPEICKELKSDPNYLPEMVVILDKGIVWRKDAFPNLQYENDKPNKIWAVVQQKRQNIFTLFIHMLSWMGWATPPPSLGGYCESLSLEGVEFY